MAKHNVGDTVVVISGYGGETGSDLEPFEYTHTFKEGTLGTILEVDEYHPQCYLVSNGEYTQYLTESQVTSY